MYASYWHRGFAFLFDCMLLYGLVYVAFNLLETGYSIILSPVAWLTGVPLFWLYFALLESSALQATLGKRMAGIIVTDEDGNPITFVRATVRTLAKFLSAAPFFFGFIIAAFTDKYQALQDFVAGTVVVYKITGL